MPFLKVTFRVRHDCPFGNLSRRFPSLRMWVWCNREREIVEVTSPRPSERDEVRRTIGDVLDAKRVAAGGGLHIFTKQCYCTLKNSVSRNLDACGLLHLLPIYYEEGWEYYNAMAFGHNDFKRFARAIENLPGELEVVSKSTSDGNVGSATAVTVDDFFAGLTKKQIDALLAAYFMGYFAFPRRADVVRIAKARGVARTTFQEHLTKAENKIVSSLVPHLQLYRPQGAPVRARSRARPWKV